MFQKKITLLATATLLTASMGANAANIDLFSTYQGPYTANSGTTQDGGSIGGGTDTTILGGERDLYVDHVAGINGDITAQVGQTDNIGSPNPGELFDALIFSVDAGVSGTATVQWDGVDNSSLLNTTGLGGKDLTEGGSLSAFEVITLSSDGGGSLGWTFDLLAYDMSGNWSNISLVSSQVLSGSGPVTSQIPLVGFSSCGFSNALVTVTCNNATGADITDLGALQLLLNSGESLDIDLRLVQVTTVPEPSVIGLMGAGIFMAGFLGRRQRKNRA